MLECYTNSNEGMAFKLVISLGQEGKNEPLESLFKFKFDIAWCG